MINSMWLLLTIPVAALLGVGIGITLSSLKRKDDLIMYEQFFKSGYKTGFTYAKNHERMGECPLNFDKYKEITKEYPIQ